MSITTVHRGIRSRSGAGETCNDSRPGVRHGSRQAELTLLKIEDYCKLACEKPRSLLDIMNSLPSGHFKFDPPKLDSMGFKAAELNSVFTRYQCDLGAPSGKATPSAAVRRWAADIPVNQLYFRP